MYKIKLINIDNNQTINSLLFFGFLTSSFWLIKSNLKNLKK